MFGGVSEERKAEGAEEPSQGAEEPSQGAGESSAPASPQRRCRWAALVVAAALVAGASAVALVGDDDCPPPGAALEVRGRVITVEELERRVEVRRALYGEQPAREGQGASAYRRDVAKAVAAGVIVEEEVDGRDLQAAENEVRDALERFIAERFPEGGRARFVEALGNEGVSEADVLAQFRRLLETRRLFEAVTEAVKVTDAEVEQAFVERKEELAVPERRRLSHLVVASKEEARAALARLQGGEPFGAVATSVSLDAATKAEGGALGVLPADELDPPFGEAAFSAVPGQPFGPVRTGLGWHVGLVEEVFPRRPVTLEEVRESLRKQLLDKERRAVWRKYLEREIAAADACYATRFRPADPDSPPAEISPGTPAGPPPGPAG